MKQSLAIGIMLSGRNVFLTGAAGSGKTFCLNKFIEIARGQGKRVSITATTGLAATHLGGNTIHAWSGIGIYDYLSNKFFEHLSKSRKSIIESTDILIIDEISMLHDFRLDMIDEICQKVRGSDLPFGGIQVIFCGDFFQLPPVNRSGGRQGRFAIYSDVWRKMDLEICYLTENFRQKDGELSEILNAMRSGELRRGQVENLLSRLDAEPENSENLTELHTTNIDVEEINIEKLNQIDSEEFFFAQTTTGAKNYVETLQKSVLAPEILRLKKGALVMAVKNSPSRQFVNGSIGEVVDFEKNTEYPFVKFQNGKTVLMVPETWEMRDGDKKRASISQIPLRLAYAITVHKSQGMTLDSARINLQKAFAEGMGYVALSRVRSLDNIFLSGINKMSLAVSSEAQNIDDFLQGMSAEAELKFADLEVDFSNNFTVEVADKKISWRDKIEKMRQDFPNAYKTWSRAEDSELRRLFLQGESVENMSLKLGRHQNSVKIRLKKHFGEDVVI